MRDFHLPGRSAVFAANGMCATSHPLAAATANDLLKAGGNAVDAAIGAAVLLGFCEPQMTGLGGDCFVLVKPAGSEEVIALNGSGRSPAGLTAATCRKKHGDRIDPGSVEAITLPGAVDAFCTLSQDYGLLGLDRILAPAIAYAKEGVPVAPRVAYDWKKAESRLQGNARTLFLRSGAVPTAGDIFRAPGQAEALERIAKYGRKGFYEGPVAEDMVSSLRALGGTHTLEDFANTKSEYSAPISGVYQGKELVEHPPNGQGATAILLANILSHFELSGLDPFGAQRAHIEAEATKLAYDARNRFVADLAYSERLHHMLDPKTAAQLAELIRPDRVLPNPAQLTEAVHKDTVYLTIVDREHLAVSLIYSIFHSFGSGRASDRFGINFHNRGAGFTLQEGHPNELGPGKRPMHTIIPAMIKESGHVAATFGVMGGQYQACGHMRFLSNLYDFSMDPQTAIDGPRCFPEAGELQLERGYSDQVRRELADLGHNVVSSDGPIGGAQAIFIDRERGVLCGASDPRKDGCALGY